MRTILSTTNLAMYVYIVDVLVYVPCARVPLCPCARHHWDLSLISETRKKVEFLGFIQLQAVDIRPCSTLLGNTASNFS